SSLIIGPGPAGRHGQAGSTNRTGAAGPAGRGKGRPAGRAGVYDGFRRRWMGDSLTLTTQATDRAVVLFDGQCELCRRSVRLLRRLDWFGALSFQDARDVEHLPPSAVPWEPERLLEQMHLLTPDRRRVFTGFVAFRYLAWRLPLLWALAPWLYLP